MAPFDLAGDFGTGVQYLFHFVIGLGFGWILEQAGFGNSKRLAEQFYFRDFTVIKVMFSAIVTTMLLIFLASGLGMLDYSNVYVNTTYLWPGIIGGLIMGVGFVIGGFCPGTSLVSMATGKVDAFFFVLGTLIGVFAFGETVDGFAEFWTSSDYGRLTLFDLTGTGPGVVILAVVLLAAVFFKGGEALEKIYGPKESHSRMPKRAISIALGLAVVIILIGQPNVESRWNAVAGEEQVKLSERQVHITPIELLSLYYDDGIDLRIWDVREEGEFNRFNIKTSQLAPLDGFGEGEARHLKTGMKGNSVIVLVGWGEENTEAAWKTMKAFSVPNVYILDGGLNNWLSVFHDKHHFAKKESTNGAQWEIPSFVGARHKAAEPPKKLIKKAGKFEKKVKLEAVGGASGGGC
jgi:uncharacterized membrane protein YedE/YeeE/rhodanese-related sulfurtransferase